VVSEVPVIIPTSAVLVCILPTEPVETKEPLTNPKSFIVPVLVRLVADSVAVAKVKSLSSLKTPAVPANGTRVAVKLSAVIVAALKS